MEEIKFLLKYYDLKIGNFNQLDKGYASRKWIISDINGKKYILKEIVKQSTDRVEAILLIQSKLEEFSPKIIKTKNNDLYFQFRERKYYLCEFINSKKLDLTMKLQDLGYFLASLHKQMSLVKNIHTTFLKVEHNISVLNDFLKYHQSNNNIEYVEIIKYKLSILEKIKFSEINFNNLTKQIIHGDFYTDNILYTGTSYKILDFDQCCEFYKEYEILRGMFIICNNCTSFSESNIILMRQFIKGYYMIDKIKSPIDAYNLYLYIQANSLSSIKPEDFGKEEKMRFARKRYAILKSLVENKEIILKILKGEFL